MSVFPSQLLAGASVNDVDRHKQSALQMAAAHDHPKLMSILLEHGVNADAVDEKYNNGERKASVYQFPIPSCR